MPHAKKPRLVGPAAIPVADINDLGTDELALIFECLPPEDIMRARVCRKMREAATITIAPMTNFCVNSVEKYNAMAAMTRALPNLQHINFGSLGGGDKYSDGEDPDEERVGDTADWTTHEIDIISNFRKLRSLKICMAPLNGRYPFLFNFPFLQSLTISYCGCLNWDLEVLAGLPLLTELFCYQIPGLTGNISNFRVLKDTLENVAIDHCHRVDGNFMDLADLPHLKALHLTENSVTGDVREIGEHDFLALQHVTLPSGVYGGRGHEFQRISDVPGTVNAIHRLIKERALILLYSFQDVDWKLSKESPDWYDWRDERFPEPPLEVEIVQAGPRLGWRWQIESEASSSLFQNTCHACEVNWLDPEPGKDSVTYEQYVRYVRELQNLQKQTMFYKGYYQPPTEDEYNRLCEGLDEE